MHFNNGDWERAMLILFCAILAIGGVMGAGMLSLILWLLGAFS